jgi:hypothetical protein
MTQMDPSRVFPMCNVGSSTERFRQKEQPWIDRYIFRPAREGNQVVKHIDTKAALGVDLVGDLTDARLVAEVSGMGFRSVMCSNLLEHVIDRPRIAHSLLTIVSPGGYLFLSCPYQYPFHPDPIDTMFRPTAEELAELFPGTRIYRQDLVRGGTFLHELLRRPLASARLLGRMALPFYRPAAWHAGRSYLRAHLPWIFKRFESTCLVLEKASPGN